MFAEVLYISAVLPYPSSFNKQYQVVLLRYRPSPQSSQPPAAAYITFLILYDEHVHLSSMWEESQMLWIYRPYLMKNAEEALFGGVVDYRDKAFAYIEAPRTSEVIAQLLTVHSGSNLVDFHLLYGCTTVICIVHNSPLMISGAPLVHPARALLYNALCAKYQLPPTSHQLIDLSKSPVPFDPADGTPGMLGISMFAQVESVDDTSIYLRPIPAAPASGCPCKLGLYQLPRDQAHPEPGSIFHVSGLQINASATVQSRSPHALASVMRARCSQSCSAFTVHECSAASSRGFAAAIIDVSHLVALSSSPSICPPVTMLEYLHRSQRQATVACVDAYVSMVPHEARGEESSRSKRPRLEERRVLLFDGTVSIIAVVTPFTKDLTYEQITSNWETLASKQAPKQFKAQLSSGFREKQVVFTLAVISDLNVIVGLESLLKGTTFA